MKQKLCILLACLLCVAAFAPITALAATYQPGETDITVTIDDTMWYVFTRDNIKDNPELEELGISYDEMYKMLHDNDAYMDAILYYEDGQYVELFIRKKEKTSQIANLSDQEDEKVSQWAEQLGKKQNAESCSVYKNQYKFVNMEYVDATYGYYLCEYTTIVNRDNYTLTFQSPAEYTEWEREEIKGIVDSIRFEIDPAVTDVTAQSKESSSIWSNVATRAIAGGIAGGLVGGVVALVSKKKKKRNTMDEPPVGPDGQNDLY